MKTVFSWDNGQHVVDCALEGLPEGTVVHINTGEQRLHFHGVSENISGTLILVSEQPMIRIDGREVVVFIGCKVL